MKLHSILLLAACLFESLAAEVVFTDPFKGKLENGWSWIRENREGWRVSDRGLEILMQPGNMWGKQNNARNVLVRSIPASEGRVIAAVSVENRPTHQYEQVNLVWYYDDSNMVKLGQELVDGKRSIVMGREQQDNTRTIAIIPIQSDKVRVRFTVRGTNITGEFQVPGSTEWQLAGSCDLPVLPGKEPRISLQCYQGPPNAEHWAKLTDFQIELGR